MSKLTGNYTTEAGKVLKGSSRIICTVAAEDEIYISNGYVLYKMARYEYAANVQPTICHDPGNWVINERGERTDGSATNLALLFADTLKTADQAAELKPCPLSVQIDRKTTAAAYYAPAGDFAQILNTKFVTSLTGCAVLRSTGTTSAAVAYNGDEPFALLNPIKPAPETTRAVKAWFVADNGGNNEGNRSDEAGRLRAELSTARAELDKLRQQLTQAEATPKSEGGHPGAPEPKTAAELIAARFTEFDGVTVVIKGAQTSAPVIWLCGDTQRHAAEIEAAGAKWSNKRSAYYVRTARVTPDSPTKPSTN